MCVIACSFFFKWLYPDLHDLIKTSWAHGSWLGLHQCNNWYVYMWHWLSAMRAETNERYLIWGILECVFYCFLFHHLLSLQASPASLIELLLDSSAFQSLKCIPFLEFKEFSLYTQAWNKWQSTPVWKRCGGFFVFQNFITPFRICVWRGEESRYWSRLRGEEQMQPGLVLIKG